MIKKYTIILFTTLLVWNMTSRASADPVSDPTGDAIGAIDLTSAEAEVYTSPDGISRLKLSINTASNIPGVVIFECDVDNSTGTGGTLSMTGIPIAPCPCKTSPGFDIVVLLFTRNQGNNATTAFCNGCTDGSAQPCGKGRKSGQWYALPAISSGANQVGTISGLLDTIPWTPGSGKNSDSYALPWSRILAEIYFELQGNPKRFNWSKAVLPSNNRWQVSVAYDANYFVDQDDLMDDSLYYNLSDWLPNGNGIKADMQTGDDLTFCEGNFDNDSDVDSQDLIIFKNDFGRGALFNPCR